MGDSCVRMLKILTWVKNEKLTWEDHIMRAADSMWTVRVTEWQPRNIRSQCKQRARWRDEIGALAGAGWSRATSDSERPLSCIGLAAAEGKDKK